MISILNQIALHRSSYLIRFRNLQRLRPGHDYCEGQMIHKLRLRELQVLLAVHCLDKITDIREVSSIYSLRFRSYGR